ncbi:MAG: hypothetical protein ABIR29_07145, partial [Chthoniobacterales bacterium]
MKKNLFVRLSLALLLSFAAGRAGATGYSGPQFYLDRGGANIAASPEFYWELEVRRLALDFHPPEKYLPSSDIAAVEATDFRAALAKGRIKPADPAAATRQHDESRAVIARTNATSTEPLPAEFPSEFADYHRGAFAYCRGPEHYEEARQAWEELLRRPEDERHYRSTWAAFMLGKLALKQNNPVAVEWFQRTRALAGAGFADSLGMAADSYGWEGRSEWKQDHPEKAAPLFLTQLALGDESAVVSLKVVIPDRKPTEGMLNYDPAPGENVAAKLEQAARDPLLRRLITAHILATESVPSEFRYGEDEEANKRSGRWLKMLQALKLTQVADAEYIGWTAYNDGDYTGATHWLELAQKKTPAALWLRAKLQRRAGKITEAAKTMAEAVENLRDSPAYSFVNAELGPGWEYFDPHWTLPKSAAGDLGLLRLERSEFLRAFEALFQADLWSDAAFVAERILTTGELKSYVDEHAVASGAATEERGKKLRYLLGRRLVRDDRYESAAAYLPSPYDQVLAKYAAASRAGHDSARTKMERARSLFTAAWLARNGGMELMGTEVAPDNFQEGGNFEAS